MKSTNVAGSGAGRGPRVGGLARGSGSSSSVGCRSSARRSARSFRSWSSTGLGGQATRPTRRSAAPTRGRRRSCPRGRSSSARRSRAPSAVPATSRPSAGEAGGERADRVGAGDEVERRQPGGERGEQRRRASGPPRSGASTSRTRPMPGVTSRRSGGHGRSCASAPPAACAVRPAAPGLDRDRARAPSRNPWRMSAPRYVPGGSSAGSGSAIASSRASPGASSVDGGIGVGGREPRDALDAATSGAEHRA